MATRYNLYLKKIYSVDNHFKESEHPRDENGRFKLKDGVVSAGLKSESIKVKKQKLKGIKGISNISIEDDNIKFTDDKTGLKYRIVNKSTKNVGSSYLNIYKNENIKDVIKKYTDVWENKTKNVWEKAKQAEPDITKDLKDITEKVGGTLEGLDFRLKSAESTVEKVTRGKKESTASELWDINRYTQIGTKENLVDNINKTLSELENRGYKVVRLQNYFLPETNHGSAYRGINVRLENKTGQKIELQFHTLKNLKTKEKSHILYDKQKKLKEETEEYKKLEIEMEKLEWEYPEGITNLKSKE